MMLILFWLFICLSLFQIAISVPLILRAVKPNPIYGFRVRATLRDPAVWYSVNHHFGWRLMVSGVVFAVTSLALNFVPGISLDTYTLACLLIFIVTLTIGMIQSMRYLGSLTRSK